VEKRAKLGRGVALSWYAAIAELGRDMWRSEVSVPQGDIRYP
jgi:hypothetical protein